VGEFAEDANSMNRTENHRQQKIERKLDHAMQHLNAGRLPQAKRFFQQIRKSVPEHPVALHMLGFIAHKMGETVNVIDLISRAIAIAPDYIDAHFNLGNALRASGRPDKAVACYRNALALDPNFTEAHNCLGLSLLDLGKIDEALACYKKALQIEPDYFQAHKNLGEAFQELGKFGEAIASYETALTHAPNNMAIIYCLGYCHQIIGYKGEAIKYFDSILKEDPKDLRYGANLRLASLGELDVPPQTPTLYMENIYKNTVANWRDDYPGHKVILESFNQNKRRPKSLYILDIGCGTGSLGEPLKPFAKQLDGIDISKDMIAKSFDRDIYDHLQNVDIMEYMLTKREAYDVIIASAVFIHYSDLKPVFEKCWGSLQKDGELIFTLFSCEGSDIRINDKNYFAHSCDYIKNISAKTHFSIDYFDCNIVMEYNKTKPRKGLVFILRKNWPSPEKVVHLYS